MAPTEYHYGFYPYVRSMELWPSCLSDHWENYIALNMNQEHFILRTSRYLSYPNLCIRHEYVFKLFYHLVL